MMLSKIVQESVEYVNIKFTAWNSQQDKEKAELLTMMWEPVNTKFKEFLISSQISLLEAELERKKAMIVEPTESDNGYMTGLTQDNIRITHNVRIGYNQAIQEDITYLQKQIEEIIKLITN